MIWSGVRNVVAGRAVGLGEGGEGEGAVGVGLDVDEDGWGGLLVTEPGGWEGDGKGVSEPDDFSDGTGEGQGVIAVCRFSHWL